MNKTVLITGASSGIGEALARKYAKEGYDLILTARREERLIALQDKIKSQHDCKVEVIVSDLNASDGVKEIYQKVKDTGLNVNVLVNNAGFGHYGPFEEADFKKLSSMVQVNITALTELTQLFVRDMIANGSGHVINVASMGSFFPGPFISVYYATKSFVLSFTEACSQEFEDRNILFTAFCPGPVATEFRQVAYEVDKDPMGHKNIPTSEEAAERTFDAMQKKQVIALLGFSNHVILLIIRFLPRFVIRRLWRIARRK